MPVRAITGKGVFMADKEQTAVTNGEVWINGELHVMCGSTPVRIKKFDSNGEPVKPPAAEKVSSSENN